MRSHRGMAPAIGVVVLVMITATTAGMFLTFDVQQEPSSPPTVVIDVHADASGELRFVHRGGTSLDPNAVRLAVYVDDQPLMYQPPIPFFTATGFASAPTGPFNTATRGEWRAGEPASFRIASTNDPTLTPGATVRVELGLNGRRILDVTTTVRG